MIILNFEPAKKIRTGVEKRKVGILVKKNVSGVIHITLDAFYYIVIDNVTYNLSKESFNCKNRKVLFYKGLNENNTITKRIYLEECKMEIMSNYLPFNVGCYCKGDLIKEDGEVKFDFKSIIKYDEVVRIEIINATKFFINNYNMIKEKLIYDRE